MQIYAKTAAALGIIPGGTPDGFARFMASLARAQGDGIEVTTGPDGVTVQQTSVRLIADIPNAHPAILEGALTAHNHRLSMRRNGLIWRIG